jgi:hypothetical protein
VELFENFHVLNKTLKKLINLELRNFPKNSNFPKKSWDLATLIQASIKSLRVNIAKSMPNLAWSIPYELYFIYATIVTLFPTILSITMFRESEREKHTRAKHKNFPTINENIFPSFLIPHSISLDYGTQKFFFQATNLDVLRFIKFSSYFK